MKPQKPSRFCFHSKETNKNNEYYAELCIFVATPLTNKYLLDNIQIFVLFKLLRLKQRGRIQLTLKILFRPIYFKRQKQKPFSTLFSIS